jgi:predicted RNA-binding Zn-ribbon protein involved in translation (DUF1610 family)
MSTICVPCRRVFRPLQTGVRFEERMLLGGANGEPEHWAPYRLWAADIYACPKCGTQIVTGLSKAPIAVSHEPDYGERAARVCLSIDDPYGVIP